jgi:hypothetical protein
LSCPTWYGGRGEGVKGRVKEGKCVFMYEYAAMRVVEMFWEREERG